MSDDIHSAASKIEGLLDMNGTMVESEATPDEYNAAPVPVLDGASDEDSSDDESQDDAPAEMPTSEEEDGSEEPAEESAIEAPKSWTASEVEQFKQLPPDIQATISRRESERDKAINVKMQQLAEERKTIESQVQQQNQAQQQYANTINQLLTLSVPELRELESIDWHKLAQDDPTEYVRKVAQRDSVLQRVNFMQQQQQQAQQQQLADFQRQHEARVADQMQKLVEDIPEFADPVKKDAITADIHKSMSSFGFSPQEIGMIDDARIVKVLHRLMTLEKAEAARKSAMSKKTAQPSSKLMQPNAAPVQRNSSKEQKMKDQFKVLRKSGDLRDAARLIEQLI